ncbi:hatching enzyme 1.2-like [Musca domestica]|uniref:Metalloendopeptidase n=1 Tax=Musca domestica TaxID=7370 RepID=A0A1I8MB45_MUSDO|nr:hatching enzyme 1.2-like [Musca domestica]
MLKLATSLIAVTSLVSLVVGTPIIPNIGDEEEMIEVSDNSLDRPTKHSKDVIDLSFYGMAMFGEPDDKNTAQLVANYSADTALVNPEELGTYLEGDILVPKNQIVLKNGITTQSSRWPRGIVPYEIRGNFNSQDRAIIEHAIAEYHRRTCIRFVPRTNQADYVSIVSGSSGCWSSVGRVGGRQEVNLQSPGCLTKPGTTIHELMHALGFLHEQNREERDSYVSIQYQNIQPSAASNFDKASRTVAFGVPYDYGSVMHYSANAFSTNGRPTIVALRSMGNTRMGQRDGFSEMDIEKLNQMYDCGYGSAVPAPIPAPAPVPAPVPVPAPSPVGGTTAIDNNIINSFISGIMTGLGFGDDPTA